MTSEPETYDPAVEFYSVFEECLNVRPHLLIETGYNRAADWVITIYDATDVSIKGAPVVVAVHHADRQKAMEEATRMLKDRYLTDRPEPVRRWFSCYDGAGFETHLTEQEAVERSLAIASANVNGICYGRITHECRRSLVAGKVRTKMVPVEPEVEKADLGRDFPDLVQTFVEGLNNLFLEEPEAIRALVLNRVPCHATGRLAEHADPYPMKGNETGSALGVLGVINAICAKVTDGRISAMFSDPEDEAGGRALLGFCRWSEEKADPGEDRTGPLQALVGRSVRLGAEGKI